MRSWSMKAMLLFGAVLVVQACGSDEEEVATDLDQSQVVTEIETTDEQGEGEASNQPEEGERSGDVTERELYLMDQYGYVVPRTFRFPPNEEVLKQSLEFMVAEGPVTEHLPSGFQAVLPADTEILGVNITEDGTAVVDFSPSFEEYPREQEEAILQALTWTLTQFENVEQIELQINGHTQENMPQGNTPVQSLTRDIGINLEGDAPVDITASRANTLYFIREQEEDVYFVPVTRRADADDNQALAVVEQLLEGPAIQSNLLTGIRSGVQLIEEPTLEDGVLTLNFNEALLTENSGTAVSEEALTMLTLSLTELEGVNEVSYQVNGTQALNRSNGETLTEPVTRPVMLNRGEF
ncbi:GerMN domain-containing protein [Geomicrobium sp. JSM 1781026]|uniref:GerMN domain-containing protein n=1 Tax=Geomicrobium sp. JSM 1781026 TaxID=3344580 RepID=UPI0035C062F4